MEEYITASVVIERLPEISSTKRVLEIAREQDWRKEKRGRYWYYHTDDVSYPPYKPSKAQQLIMSAAKNAPNNYYLAKGFIRDRYGLVDILSASTEHGPAAIARYENTSDWLLFLKVDGEVYTAQLEAETLIDNSEPYFAIHGAINKILETAKK